MKPSHLRTPRESRNTEFGQYHAEHEYERDYQDTVVVAACIIAVLCLFVIFFLEQT